MQQAMHPTVVLSDPPPVPPDADIVQAFPQFEILQLIGAGGMGRVYQVRQPHLERVAALKILPKEMAADPAFAERFTREGRALAKLSHPNIVGVFDFGHSGDYYWLLMEYVDGVNLRQAMHAGAMQPREALQIVPHLCAALEYAHSQGVLHRDIKPENILIDTAGRVKIADFGIAKFSGEGAPHITLTRSGASLGTPAYMAPEQIERPQDVDHRADIYSLGVVFYEMLTGELPLGRFPAPSERSGVDPRLDSVVFRTLEKQRERRYQSAGEMKTQVESVASMPPPVQPPPLARVLPGRTSRKAIWGFILVVAGLLFGAAGLMVSVTQERMASEQYYASQNQLQARRAQLQNLVQEAILGVLTPATLEEKVRALGLSDHAARVWRPGAGESQEEFKRRMQEWMRNLEMNTGTLPLPGDPPQPSSNNL